MKSRLERCKEFIDTEFIDSLKRNKEYSLRAFDEDLQEKIKNRQFKRIVFTGMGCSAIVSDVIKGFFISQGMPIQVEVINDYDIDYLIDKSAFGKETLVIISSYSGYSQEPINAYAKIKRLTRNIVFLTSGGKLGKIGEKEKVSIIHWVLKKPDREYPLFHVPQYFSILLEIFYRLGLIESDYQKELAETAEYLQTEFGEGKLAKAKKIADEIKDRDIILIASPKWHLTLLKLAKMYLNEIAMVPSHRNFLHEFTHSEIAVCTDPKIEQAVIIFRDKSEDKYTRDKIENLLGILKENKKTKGVVIDLDQQDFLKKFFATLLFVCYITYYLGINYKIKSRELISRASGNSWYNIKTIRGEESEL